MFDSAVRSVQSSERVPTELRSISCRRLSALRQSAPAREGRHPPAARVSRARGRARGERGGSRGLPRAALEQTRRRGVQTFLARRFGDRGDGQSQPADATRETRCSRCRRGTPPASARPPLRSRWQRCAAPLPKRSAETDARDQIPPAPFRAFRGRGVCRLVRFGSSFSARGASTDTYTRPFRVLPNAPVRRRARRFAAARRS